MGQSIAIAQRAGRVVDRHKPAGTQEHRAIGDAVDGFQIVGGNEDDASVAAEIGQPAAQRRRRRVVEPGEGLVEQDQSRLVQQRALEREPLAHPPREPSRRIVALIEPGTLERRASPRGRRPTRRRRGQRTRRFSAADNSG